MIKKRTKTLGELIKTLAEQNPDKVTVQIKRFLKTERWTFGDIYKNSQKVATYFTEELKLKKGDRVVIWASSMPEWSAIFFGCALSGVILVPADIRSSQEFLQNLVEKTKPLLLIRSEKLIWPLPQQKFPELILEDLLSLLPKKSVFEEASIKPTDIFELLFTSGTTGKPKGVIITHENLLTNLYACLKRLPKNRQYRGLSILPLSHSYEQIAGLLALVAFEGTITYLPFIHSATIVKSLAQEKINTMIVVPQILTLLLSGIEREAKQTGKQKQMELALALAKFLPFMRARRLLFSSLHKKLGGQLDLVISGGAPLDLKLAQTWELMGVRIVEGYGTTETGPVISMDSFHDRRLETVGKVLSVQKVKIVDDEIWAKGKCVSPGYWEDEEKTREAFIDGWYKTGDMGFLDKKGYLYVFGRKKNMIVLPSGQNVYPEDIEPKLNKHPLVEESCVVGIKREKGEVVHAVLKGEFKNPNQVKKIVEEVNENLAPHQWVLEYSVWPFPEFPKTHTLKIKTGQVKNWVLKRETAETEQFFPTEVKVDPLIKILTETCSCSPEGISDKSSLVTDLKLDSLLRAELVVRISEELGIGVSEENIRETTTVTDLRKIVEEGKPAKKTTQDELWIMKTRVKLMRTLAQNTLGHLLLRIVCSWKVEGLNNLKNLVGPLIFAPNHTSHLDAALVYKVLPREIRKKTVQSVAADVWGEKRTKRLIAHYLIGAYLLSREGEIQEGLEKTAQFLDKDYNVILFPEGELSPSGELLPFKNGVGYLATTLEVPVIPVYVSGAYNIWKIGEKWPRSRGRVKIVFGKPLFFDPQTSYEEATKIIQEKVLTLKPK